MMTDSGFPAGVIHLFFNGKTPENDFVDKSAVMMYNFRMEYQKRSRRLKL